MHIRKTGFVLMVIGFLVILITGYTFSVGASLVKTFDSQATKDKKNNVSWTPLIGVAILVLGAGTYVYGSKKPRDPVA